jgi:hypothetical protein
MSGSGAAASQSLQRLLRLAKHIPLHDIIAPNENALRNALGQRLISTRASKQVILLFTDH